jgi:phospholipid transport system substrate-binding protein
MIPSNPLPLPSNRVALFGRRAFVTGAVAGVVALQTAGGALALTVENARAMITSAVGEISDVIESRSAQPQMFAQFERIFERYADVDIIARSALGPAARSASPAQMRAFTEAFKGYLARKYGRRFREFDGGRIVVKDARPLKSFYEVITTAHLKGEAPFEVRFHVSDRSGRDLFFNMIIEGVNMLATERTEIGAMLDRRNGNVDALTQDLRKAG